jgi:hypothetical protein
MKTKFGFVDSVGGVRAITRVIRGECFAKMCRMDILLVNKSLTFFWREDGGCGSKDVNVGGGRVYRLFILNKKCWMVKIEKLTRRKMKSKAEKALQMKVLVE